jgi:hypothetical protein
LILKRLTKIESSEALKNKKLKFFAVNTSSTPIAFVDGVLLLLSSVGLVNDQERWRRI